MWQAKLAKDLEEESAVYGHRNSGRCGARDYNGAHV